MGLFPYSGILIYFFPFYKNASDTVVISVMLFTVILVYSLYNRTVQFS